MPPDAHGATLRATLDRVEALKRTLPAGMTLPELGLRFILRNQRVSTTIPGMRKEHHVQNTAVSGTAPVDDALMRALRGHRWDRRHRHRR